MAIGLGVILLLIGLILAFGAVTLPASINDNINGHTLGWILIVVGVLALVLSLVVNGQRSRRSTVVEERRIDDGRL